MGREDIMVVEIIIDVSLFFYSDSGYKTPALMKTLVDYNIELLFP